MRHYKKIILHKNRARICRLFTEPRNRFQACLPVRQPCFSFQPGWRYRFLEIDSWAPHKRFLQIRAQLISLSHMMLEDILIFIFVWRVLWRWAGAGGRVVPAPPDRPSECPLYRRSAAPSRDTWHTIFTRCKKKSVLNKRKQCCGCVTFWYGSGSTDPYFWLTDPDSVSDPAFFVGDLQDGS